MNVVIIFVIAFIGLAVVARVGLSSATRERRSMSGHRHTLETISKVADAPHADHDVRSFKVEPLRPVRLDLSKLDDLTDPDLIRITSPLGSDSPETPHESSEAGLDDEVAPPDEVTTSDSPDPQVPTVRSEGQAGAEPLERAIFGGGLIFGEDEDFDEPMTAGSEFPSEDATILLTPMSDTDALAMTQAMAPIPSSVALSDDDIDDEPSEARLGETRTHRVYGGGRNLPLSVMAVGAGVIAVVLGVGFFMLGRSSSSQTTPSTQASVPITSHSSTSRSGASRKQTSGSKSISSTKKSDSTKPTGSSSTSVSSGSASSAAPTSFSPVSSNSSYATYDIPGGAKTVVVSASQPCWVADSNSANGPILWDETLPAGGSYTISSSSASLWIEVGNAHAFQMDVNGVPVTFSAPPGVFNFDLVAAPSSSVS